MVQSNNGGSTSNLPEGRASGRTSGALRVDRRTAALDLALLATAIVMFVTDVVVPVDPVFVFSFHLIFILLALGAFFWSFRGLALRAGLGVALVTVVLLVRVFQGRIEAGELVAVPALIVLLGLLLGLVSTITRRRARTQAQLQRDQAYLREVLQDLEESEQRYKSLFEHNPDAVYSLDLEGNFLTANPVCEEISGYKTGELLQMTFVSLLVPEDLSRMVEHFRKAVGGEPQNYEIAMLHRDGHRVELNVTNVPIVVAGKIVGVYGIAKDVTERKRAEEALQRSEARFRSVVESVGEGLLITDADDIVLYMNPRMTELTGYTAEEMLGRPAYELLLPPEEWPEMFEHNRRRFTGVTDRYEMRIKRKDGGTLWTEVNATPYRDASGEVVGTLGAITDITERKRAEEALRRAEEKYRSIFENAIEGIFQISVDGRIVTANPMLAHMLGYETPEELMEVVSDVNDQLYVEPDRRDELNRLLEQHGGVSGFEIEVYGKDGSTIWVSMNARSIYDAEGTLLGYEGTVEDITEPKALKERLEYQAFHDPLTDLANRALFLNRLEHALVGTDRREGFVAVLFMDLDNFKDVNDSLGHEVGDRLLVEVAGRLRACVRAEDTVARLGGDEFTVLFEDVGSLDDATRVAERILEALQAPFAIEGHEVLTAASIGIATSASSREKPEDLLRRADLAMYRAKETGKARYEVLKTP